MPDMQLRARTNLEILPAGREPRLLYLLLEAEPGDDTPGRERRLPVNLALVVDVSRSMRVPLVTEEQFEWLARQGHVREVMVDGVPVWQVDQAPASFAAQLPTSLVFLAEAVAGVQRRLRAGDRAAVVAFAQEAQILAAGEAPLPADLGAGLQDLDLGDDTCMARGLAVGLDAARQGSAGAGGAGRVSRVLVFTDGFTLDEAECRALAQRARQMGIPISTLGLGVEFNEELLIGLAEASGGRAYLVREPQDIPGAFDSELQRVEAVSYRGLELKLHLTPGVELRQAFRVRPAIGGLGEVPSEGGSINLFLGDLEWDSPPAVLLELVVPPRPAGAYRLCQAVLAYEDPNAAATGGRATATRKTRQDVVVRYAEAGDGALPLDPGVMNIVERVAAFRLQTQALAQAASGDLAGATVKLRAAATRLLGTGQADLAQAALREADNLEQQGQMSSMGRKEMRYTTRRL